MVSVTPLNFHTNSNTGSHKLGFTLHIQSVPVFYFIHCFSCPFKPPICKPISDSRCCFKSIPNVLLFLLCDICHSHTLLLSFSFATILLLADLQFRITRLVPLFSCPCIYLWQTESISMKGSLDHEFGPRLILKGWGSGVFWGLVPKWFP